MWAAASKMRASNSSSVSIFHKLRPSSKKKKKSDGVKSGQSNRSISLTVQNYTHTCSDRPFPRSGLSLLDHPVY